jgi:hypothetical protein
MSLIDSPEHWRARATQTRSLLDQISDPESRQSMLEIAESYERLALRAEARRHCTLPPEAEAPQ